MTTAETIQSIKDDVARLLNNIEYGNQSTNKQTLNSATRQILQELCNARDVVGERDNGVRRRLQHKAGGKLV